MIGGLKKWNEQGRKPGTSNFLARRTAGWFACTPPQQGTMPNIWKSNLGWRVTKQERHYQKNFIATSVPCESGVCILRRAGSQISCCTSWTGGVVSENWSEKTPFKGQVPQSAWSFPGGIGRQQISMSGKLSWCQGDVISEREVSREKAQI